VDIREAIAPLMESGVVAVERIGKTTENVYLLKDVFGYRAPPFESIQRAEKTKPKLIEKYQEYVTGFFSPAPPNRGYNPTIPVDDPNSPIIEDRREISAIISNSLCYKVLQCLREEPLTVKEISNLTDLPEAVVETALWKLERDNIAIQLSREGIWGIITNPKIENFLPEYILPTVSQKVSNKNITPEIAKRYLELLIHTWGEHRD
jgi:predicted transcriptional regulator